jgi:hypothetical protein
MVVTTSPQPTNQIKKQAAPDDKKKNWKIGDLSVPGNDEDIDRNPSWIQPVRG